MARFMINCKEHSILVSENLDRPFTFWEWIVVWMHQIICPPCNLLRKQLNTIRAACRSAQLDDPQMDPDACRLPDEARNRIKTAIKEIQDEE